MFWLYVSLLSSSGCRRISCSLRNFRQFIHKQDTSMRRRSLLVWVSCRPLPVPVPRSQRRCGERKGLLVIRAFCVSNCPATLNRRYFQTFFHSQVGQNCRQAFRHHRFIWLPAVLSSEYDETLLPPLPLPFHSLLPVNVCKIHIIGIFSCLYHCHIQPVQQRKLLSFPVESNNQWSPCKDLTPIT